MMNVLPFIQKQWQLIGFKLRLSSDLLDTFCKEAVNDQIPTKSFNTFCCVKVLTHWLSQNDNITCVAIIEAISAPHIGLKHEILNIGNTLTYNSNLSGRFMDKHVKCLSQNHIKPYGVMKINVCKELCDSHFNINDALQYLKSVNINPSILKSIANFQDLFNLFEMNKLMHMADVCWLINIARQAHCESALRCIEEYCNLLIADKILWGDSQMCKSITYLVAKVSNKTLYNCTIKHCADVKAILSKVTDMDETDSILSFSEASSKDCSLTFYWRVEKLITIPEVMVTSCRKDCRDYGITHIGTITDGNLKTINISESQIDNCEGV